MATADDPSRNLLGPEWTGLDRVVERFEEAWQQGGQPDVAGFLPAAPAQCRELLVELLFVDLERRIKAGESARVEAYFHRFPELTGNPEHVLALVAWEAELRRRTDPSLTFSEYTQRFPEHGAQLFSILEALDPSRTIASPAPSKGSSGGTTAEAPAPMSLAGALQALPLLPGTQVKELPALQEQFPTPAALGEELQKRGWLTAFQVHRLLQGRGRELVLGPYVVLDRIGEGGMGVVYEGRTPGSPKRVALKVFLRERLQNPDALRRFRREVQAASRLDHPNIVRVFEARQDQDLHFLVMEHLAGADLQHLVEQSGPLPVDRACDFIRQAALGLRHAHEKGLVHRDIKPSNIMVTPPAANLAEDAAGPAAMLTAGAVVKILDMGLARIAGAADVSESVSTLTRAGTLMGTPDYMAPEQWEDAHTADIRADLYSLGCTLYFVLSGQVPFPGGSLVQKLDKHRSQAPVPVERLRPEVPPPVALVVTRLLAKRPSDRFQTPAEVAEVLERCQRGSRFLSRPPLARGPAEELGSRPGEVRCFRGHTGAVNGVAVAPDGRHIVSVGEEAAVRLWERDTGRELRQFKGHTDPVKCVAFSADGRYLVTGGTDRTVRLWEVSTGREVRQFKGHTDVVKSVVFSGDGRHVLTAGSDRVLRLWEVSTGRRLVRFEGHSGDVNGAVFSPDGRQVLSCSWDKTVRLWEVKNGKEVHCFGGTYSAWQWLIVLGVAFLPDGRRFAAAGSDNLLRLCQADDGRELVQFKGHNDQATCIAASPDGQHLLSGGRDHTVRLWAGATGLERHRFDDHSDPVTCVAFTPDGRAAVSGSLDRSVRLWQLLS
jgi:WD40 repeat protein/serine/threonine protein kinase